MAIDTADQSYMQGLTMGLRMAQQRIYAMKQLGCNVDADKWMAEFKKAFNSDTMPNIQMVGMEFQQLAQRAESRAEERKMEEIANSQEAQDNVKIGISYLDSVRKADPAVQVAPSGLAYKIENPGTGDSITDKDRVYVYYTGKFTDGKVFGGKATLYIPGNLGYGPQGQPGAGIGPNQMLVFDVEVVGVNEAPDAKK